MPEADFFAALRRLPLHSGAGELADDVASLAGLTITTDTIVETVHFLSGDLAEDVAWKLVAVNLSDLAAKGATPEGVLLNYPIGDTGWDRAFLAGLAEALTAFDCSILGGDTVSLPARALRVLTLTAIGRDAAPVPRSGATASDALWVTGTIGDAGAGLSIAKGKDGPPELLAAYRRPVPRLAEGRSLAPHVHAMMDVSDGLLLDAVRMAEASGLAVAVDLALVPLSDAYRGFAGEDRAARIAAATAGDDYQLLFAAPADWTPSVAATRIGAFAAGSGLMLTEGAINVPLPAKLGFSH